MIGGEGFWQQIPEQLKITTDYYVGIGTTNPEESLDVLGRVKADDMESPTFTLEKGGAVQIYQNSDDMMFKDYNNPSGISLNTLKAGGVLSKSGNTYTFPLTTDNLHIGESAATTYKLKVTGDTYLQGDLVVGENTHNGSFYLGSDHLVSLARNGNNFDLSFGGGPKISYFDNFGYTDIGGTGQYFRFYNNDSIIEFISGGSTDTIATRAYARSFGGDGGGYEFGNGLTNNEGVIIVGDTITTDIEFVSSNQQFRVVSHDWNSYFVVQADDDYSNSNFTFYSQNPIGADFSSFHVSEGEISSRVSDGDNLHEIYVVPEYISFESQRDGDNKELRLGQHALQYLSDYSSSFKSRSIPDSAYVAYMISQSVSGLSSDSTWTEATIIDSLHIEGAIKWENVDQKSGYAFLYRNDTTGIIHVDSSAVVEASWAIKMQLPDIIEFVNDTVNSEYKWYYKQGDSILYTYGLNYGNESPNITFQKLAAMQELNIRWLAEQAHKQNELDARIRAIEANAIEHKTALLLKIIIAFLGICVGLLTFFAFTKQNFITYE